MTRSLATVPVEEIHTEFAKVMGFAKNAIEIGISHNAPFILTLRTECKEINTGLIKALDALMVRHGLDCYIASTKTDSLFMSVILRKKIEICTEGED